MSEVIVSIVLLFLLSLLLNPTNLSMPQDVHVMILLGVIIAFMIFATFIFKENVKDEREALHRFMAARFAYLFGTTSMLIGVVIQSFSHRIDVWLIISLTIMILAKVIGLFYAKNRY